MLFEAPRQAPYAPVSNVLSVIRRLRQRGLPDVLTTQELPRLGVPEGNVTRTLAALRFLGLIDDENRRTEIFNRLGRASTGEYPEILAEILKAAYSPVFGIVDPAEATDIQLNDAFRSFAPQAQRNRMIVLFTGLCQEAGIRTGGPPEERTRAKNPRGERNTPPQNGRHRPPVTQSNGSRSSGPLNGTKSRYYVIHALVDSLPSSGEWTEGEYDLWLAALEANVRYLIRVVDPAATTGS